MCSYKPEPLPNNRESTADVKHFTWILFSIRFFLDILFVAWSSPWVLLAKFGLFQDFERLRIIASILESVGGVL